MTFEDLKLYTKKPGTYTITAIFDGNDEYAAGQTQFILIVPENPDEPPVVIPLPSDDGQMTTPDLSFLEPVVTIEEDIKTNKYDLQIPYNPSKLPIVWSCSDDNVQFDVMNNKIVIANIGEYTITATFNGSDEYYGTSASYTLRLTDDEGNIVHAQRNYKLYFEEDVWQFFDNDEMRFPMQKPLTQRTEDGVVPQEIMDLCYYTIDDDPTHFSGGDMIFSELGEYTITLHFEGNDDWRAQEISYTFRIVEREDPELSFKDQKVFVHRNDEGKYVLQILNNPHGLSPIKWAISPTQSGWITLKPENNVCYITRLGSFPIIAVFEGNGQYKRQEAAYDLVLIGSQEDAEIFFSWDSSNSENITKITETILYETYNDIGEEGYRANLPNLINPYNLPVTWNVSTGDMTLTADGKQVIFYNRVENATITATFEGDDTWEPMVATLNVSFIAWANRPEPTIYFQEEVVETSANANGVYTLQRVISTDIDKSRLTWRVDGLSDGWRIEETQDHEDHYLYVDEWGWYTIVVEFEGDEYWSPVQATYTLKPQRNELQIYFKEPVQYYYRFQEGYTGTKLVQPCYAMIDGEEVELAVHYSTSSRVCWISSDSVLFNREGQYVIRADYYGDNKYETSNASYWLLVSSEEDPQVVEVTPTIRFTTEAVAIIRNGDYYDLTQYIEVTPSELRNVQFRLVDNSVPAVISGDGLFTQNDGEFVIEAYVESYYDGNTKYNAATSTNQLHFRVYTETFETQDIVLAFFSEMSNWSLRGDNTYDLEYVYWRLASAPDIAESYQRCTFNLVWSCDDNNAVFDFTDPDFPTIQLPNGEGIYAITATFAGNELYNSTSATYHINVGNVAIDPDIRFRYNTVDANENYPDNLYELQAITKPNDIQDSDLVWSVSPSSPNEIRGNQVYVWDISEDVTITVSFAGNAKYLPKTVSYTLHVIPETIVKRDVTISFEPLSVDWDYNDYYQVETSPLTPTLSEEVPLVWEINNGAQIRGNRIYENRVSETILVEVQNPKIYLEDVGTYTVTARFVGDRYRNPASATYTINFEYNFSNVYFAEPKQYHEYDTESSHYYYPIQAVTKPNDIEVTYYLYIDENTSYVIDQAQGCDLIGDIGDWEIRAYWTEHGITKFTSYTLVVYDSLINEDEGTVSFDEQSIESAYSSNGIYTLQRPTCTGVYELISTEIRSTEYDRTIVGYPLTAELEEGTTNTITLRYKVGGDDNYHETSYTLYVRPEYYGLTFNPSMDYSKIYLNPSNSISNRYTIIVSFDAENVCRYGNGKSAGEYDEYYFTHSFENITISANQTEIDFPISKYHQEIDYYTGEIISISTYPSWYRFTKATMHISIKKGSRIVGTFTYNIERNYPKANYYYDTIVWNPITWHNSYPTVLPYLSIDTTPSTDAQQSILYCLWNDEIGPNPASETGPIVLTPCDSVRIASGTKLIFEAPNNTTANVTMYKPNNETYMAHTSETHTENITMNLVGQFRK